MHGWGLAAPGLELQEEGEAGEGAGHMAVLCPAPVTSGRGLGEAGMPGRVCTEDAGRVVARSQEDSGSGEAP